jgi:hypothetical protein
VQVELTLFGAVIFIAYSTLTNGHPVYTATTYVAVQVPEPEIVTPPLLFMPPLFGRASFRRLQQFLDLSVQSLVGGTSRR